MDKNDIIAVKHLLQDPKRVAIIPHRSPDGDAMGSTLGMYHFLRKLGHYPTVVSPNNFPYNLAWLPSSERVVIYEGNKEHAERILGEAELVVLMDFNVLHRTGEMEHALERLTVPKIMIDHHQMPQPCAQYIYSDTSFSSTCEMLYRFIGYMDATDEIDTTIATCIYTGMVTDTGSFKYASTTAETHEIAAELIRRGVDNAYVHDALFDNSSYNSLLLLGTALNNLKIIGNGTISYTTLSTYELESHHYVKGDTEGIVNYGLSIKGVTFTAIFIEHTDENIIKISFRSKGDFDVNLFARQHFDGGGHRNAAGGKSKATLAETIRRFEEIVMQMQTSS